MNLNYYMKHCIIGIDLRSKSMLRAQARTYCAEHSNSEKQNKNLLKINSYAISLEV